jgi:hypothetical protein
MYQQVKIFEQPLKRHQCLTMPIIVQISVPRRLLDTLAPFITRQLSLASSSHTSIDS